ncbi:hypothetical protein [Streptomyces sp. NPDC051569]|uniref:hypothetical protein n=1 Tax=Streptomyces sp. NPDC051569 TaxID=3365661 RepID=UPI0037AD19AF
MTYPYSPQDYEAMEKVRKDRIKQKHDERLEKQANGGQGRPTGLDTTFMNYSIKGLKRMIENTDPGQIYEISQHWKQVHLILSGGDGDGTVGGVDSVSSGDSIAGMLDKAVKDVLDHWEGAAAQAFSRKAQDISRNIKNAAAYANLASGQMHLVQQDLRQAKEQMREIREPGFFDKVGDAFSNDEKDDTQLQKDLANGVNARAAAEANADSLVAAKEEQLKAVALMESLGANYKVYAKNLSDNAVRDDQRRDIPPPSSDVAVPPPVTVPTPSATGPGAAGAVAKPWSAGDANAIGGAPAAPTGSVPPGGQHLPPTIGTNIDSLAPGQLGAGPGLGSVGSGASGGGGTAGGGFGSGAIPPVGGVGLGSAGGTRGSLGAAGGRGIPGATSGATSGRGAAGGGAGGAGAAAGRSAGGRPGAGGMGGGAGAGAGRGGAGTGGRGSLARARGGVVGAAKGVTGKSAGTGAGGGLHGSRGGSQRSATPGGGMGGAAGRGGKRSDKENGGDRPDYLVEDEETWVSEDRRRVVPPTVE